MGLFSRLRERAKTTKTPSGKRTSTSRKTRSLTSKSPKKVRVSSTEFQSYAAKLAATKHAVLAQMDIAARYEKNFKQIYAAAADQAEKFVRNYPEQDDFSAYAKVTEGDMRGANKLYDSKNAKVAVYKKMTEEYRKYLAEISAEEKMFSQAEKLEKSIHHSKKKLAKLQEAKKRDQQKIDETEVLIQTETTNLQNLEEDIIKRMKLTLSKKERVLHAGHVATWIGFSSYVEGLQHLMKDQIRVAEDSKDGFIALSDPTLKLEDPAVVQKFKAEEVKVPKEKPVDPAVVAAKLNEEAVQVPTAHAPQPSAPELSAEDKETMAEMTGSKVAAPA
mmetsp:Transcript_38839/g.94991  ORF Transcript_38839/g.94991 Transcript_38839/m.94991 type:complete len:332 (+) Transcript_38839:138-1133(+)